MSCLEVKCVDISKCFSFELLEKKKNALLMKYLTIQSHSDWHRSDERESR